MISAADQARQTGADTKAVIMDTGSRAVLSISIASYGLLQYIANHSQISLTVMSTDSSVDPQRQASLSLLYSDHHGWLFGWLRRRLGCTHNAADVAHDTFARLIASREGLGLREPRAFLATVARRLLIDRARRQRIEQAYFDELPALSDELEGFPSAEQVACAIEALEQIARALDGLPAGPRAALLLRHLDGYSHQQIADEFEVSTKTVQAWLIKAMVHCHTALADSTP